MSPFRPAGQNCDGEVAELGEAIVTKYGTAQLRVGDRR